MTVQWLPAARVLVACLIGTASATSIAALNDICGCNAGLKPSVTQYSSHSALNLSFLKQIDETQYDKMKKDGTLEGQYKVIGGMATYDEFKESRRKYLENEKFDLNEEQSQSLLLSNVPTEDWGKCKIACIKSQSGFVCDVAKVTMKIVVVSCSWRPEGPAASRRVHVTANQRSINPPKVIPANTTKDWQFSRNPAVPLLLTFDPENGTGQTVSIDAVPKILDRPIKEVALGYCIGKGGVVGRFFWGPLGAVCNGIPEWDKYVTDGKQAAQNLCSCVGPKEPVSMPPRMPLSLEGARLWGPEGEACAGNPAWGNYKDSCVPISKLTLCACAGHGATLRDQTLWGPKGAKCAGFDAPEWKTYQQYCVGPN